jgi:hypothetical protein
MRQIADIDGIERPDGSFLHRLTPTPDPQLPFELARPYGGLLAANGHSSGRVGRQQSLSAVLVVCTSELREFRTEMAIAL